MKEKSELFYWFQEFKALVENQTNSRIKTLRTDRGGEYMSKAFKNYLNEHGIHHQKTVPYTPLQNGVAERKIIILMEMTRCMLSYKKMPKVFWGEAVVAATYI